MHKFAYWNSPYRAYQGVSDSICPPVWEAIVARMLWAMGKKLPEGVRTDEARPEHVQELRSCKHNVKYTQINPLPGTVEDADDGDE